MRLVTGPRCERLTRPAAALPVLLAVARLFRLRRFGGL